MQPICISTSRRPAADTIDSLSNLSSPPASKATRPTPAAISKCLRKQYAAAPDCGSGHTADGYINKTR